jgi:hypothetical protein
MEGGGFEPPKASPTDLQSVPFDRSGTPPKRRGENINVHANGATVFSAFDHLLLVLIVAKH